MQLEPGTAVLADQPQGPLQLLALFFWNSAARGEEPGVLEEEGKGMGGWNAVPFWNLPSLAGSVCREMSTPLSTELVGRAGSLPAVSQPARAWPLSIMEEFSQMYYLENLSFRRLLVCS